MSSVASVVGDANVLLSAIAGRAARRVMVEYGVRVHVARFNSLEVLEYLPHFARRYGVPEELLRLEWRLLPVEVHAGRVYAPELRIARRLLAARDPDDAHPLALARFLGLPLWTNDRDLTDLGERAGVSVLTTARLLARLEC